MSTKEAFSAVAVGFSIAVCSPPPRPRRHCMCVVEETALFACVCVGRRRPDTSGPTACPHVTDGRAGRAPRVDPRRSGAEAYDVRHRAAPA